MKWYWRRIYQNWNLSVEFNMTNFVWIVTVTHKLIVFSITICWEMNYQLSFTQYLLEWTFDRVLQLETHQTRACSHELQSCTQQVQELCAVVTLRFSATIKKLPTWVNPELASRWCSCGFPDGVLNCCLAAIDSCLCRLSGR